MWRTDTHVVPTSHLGWGHYGNVFRAGMMKEKLSQHCAADYVTKIASARLQALCDLQLTPSRLKFFTAALSHYAHWEFSAPLYESPALPPSGEMAPVMWVQSFTHTQLYSSCSLEGSLKHNDLIYGEDYIQYNTVLALQGNAQIWNAHSKAFRYNIGLVTKALCVQWHDLRIQMGDGSLSISTP